MRVFVRSCVFVCACVCAATTHSSVLKIVRACLCTEVIPEVSLDVVQETVA